MPISLTIKNIPDDLAQALRDQARRNHRSIQGELMSILERSVAATPSDAGPHAETSPLPSRRPARPAGLGPPIEPASPAVAPAPPAMASEPPPALAVPSNLGAGIGSGDPNTASDVSVEDIDELVRRMRQQRWGGTD